MAEANETISLLLMLPKSCVCMFARISMHLYVSINLYVSIRENTEIAAGNQLLEQTAVSCILQNIHTVIICCSSIQRKKTLSYFLH